MTKPRTSLLDLERFATGAGKARGRSRATRSVGLGALEAGLGHGHGHRAQRKPPAHERCYDTGEPISLQTSRGVFSMYPQQLTAQVHRQAFIEPFGGTDPYVVESYEQPAPAPNDDAVRLEDEAEHPGLADGERDHTRQPAPPAAPVSADEVPARSVATAPADIDDEDLDEELRQIREEQAETPASPQPPVPVLAKPGGENPGTTAAESETVGPSSLQADTVDPHAVFDTMAERLGHATTFDLGRVNLNRRFNEIERALDAEEQQVQANAPPARTFSEAAALDDGELIDDLSVVSRLLEDKLREARAATSEREVAPGPRPGLATPPAASPAVEPASSAERPDTERVEKPSAVADESRKDAEAKGDLDRPPVASPTQAEEIAYDVPAATATDGVSPAAVAAAMLVAWQDRTSLDVTALKTGDGVWAPYGSALGDPDDAFFETWGLTVRGPERLTVERLRHDLRADGPIWMSSPVTGRDVRVVTGVDGDRDTADMPETVSITVIDPGAGAEASPQRVGLAQLIEQLGGGDIRIAHLDHGTETQADA